MMHQLELYPSNRLEILAAMMAQIFRKTPLSSPFKEEIILVQSKGMERWVSMALALRLGVCANMRFPFPNAFFHEIFQKVIGDLPDRTAFDREVMTWKLMDLPTEMAGSPGFEEVRHYLGDSGDDLKRYQLAARIAYAFDQYLLYRPEMISRWEAGEDEDWQARLFRAVAGGHEGRHAAALGKQLDDRLKGKAVDLDKLPERVSVFGISTLPPFHLHLLESLSAHIPVRLFLMNPCREYWGTVTSKRDVRRLSRRAPGTDPETLHLDPGHPLLAGMGVLGRDFFDRIAEIDPEMPDSSLFESPAGDTLLTGLQSDILTLQDRGASDEAPFRTVEPTDDSIQVHACHSPIREVEVLHDRLLDRFERTPDLRPADVLVMTPDIETYAPFIAAVFDRPADDPKRIPFTIADRSYRSDSRIIETFLRLLDLAGGRYGAEDVLAILEEDGVRRRFDLDQSDLDRARQWVGETRICWGIDAPHRSRMDLPDFHENTWRAGLDRLLLGYALPGDGEARFLRILPYDKVEGDSAATMGRFVELIEQIFFHIEGLSRPRSPAEWSETLLSLTDALFSPGPDASAEMATLRETLRRLAETAAAAEMDGPVGISAIRAHLKARLQDEGFGYGFISGGVTFCAMLPMRSIPFRVICMLGMDHDAYPRPKRAPGFDRIAQNPRPGDRSQRDDERYLFLESILSAREVLYISHVGQSARDNTPMPPSVLVSELIDTLRRGYRAPGDTDMENQLVIRHRLQPFSPDYFTEPSDGRLFSFDEDACEAARALVSDRPVPGPFIDRGLPEPEPEWRTVDLGALYRFFRNPSEYLLTQRLGVRFGDGEEMLPETEPFQVDGLDRYGLGQRLVAGFLAGTDSEDLREIARAEGRIPHGTVGKCAFDDIRDNARAFADGLSEHLVLPPFEPLPVDLPIGDFRLTGNVEGVYPTGLIRYRYATIKGKDRIGLWLPLLVLNILKPKGYPLTGTVVGAEKGVLALETYGPVDDPETILEQLLKLYWDGLVRPLPFFPESSWAYVSAKKNNLAAARKVWHNDYNYSEDDNAYFQRCFDTVDPIDSTFEDIARTVYGPMMDSKRET